MNYEQYIKEHPNILNSDPINYPEDLKIATITLTCSIPVIFVTQNIAKYLPLSYDFINSVKWGKSSEIFRQLIPIKEKKKAKKKKVVNSNNFYNQISIVINSPQNVNEGLIRMNIKLFGSGAIQVTGCKRMSYFFWAIDKLFHMLCEKTIIGSEEIEFARPIYFLHVMGLRNIKIGMINNVFFAGFKINREKLFNCIIRDKLNCSFDQSRAQSINLKYKTENMIKPITFLIFRTGKVMISGMGSYANIIECYKFINIYFDEHYDKIVQD